MRRQRPLDVNLWLPTRQTHAEYFGQREFRSGDVGRAGASVFGVWPVLYGSASTRTRSVGSADQPDGAVTSTPREQTPCLNRAPSDAAIMSFAGIADAQCRGPGATECRAAASAKPRSRLPPWSQGLGAGGTALGRHAAISHKSGLKPRRAPPPQSRRLSAQYYAITSNKALKDINRGRSTASLSGCGECGTTSVGANPLHHGTEAI